MSVPWEQVPWSTVKSVVSRLQSLIFRAALENDTEKLHAFQTRLLDNAHAKLMAVRRATDLNQGEASIGTNVLLPGELRVKMARKLRLSDKCVPFCVSRKQRLGDSLENVVRDRAKQMLVKLALEPEWEARFEPGAIGFRPRRTYRDAIDAISLSLKAKPKYVMVVDSCHLFQEMQHRAVMSKLRHSLPCLVAQVQAWLNGGIMAFRWQNPGLPNPGDYGIISPLLANIALHGMETAFKEWAAKMYPNYPTPLLIRYCEQFVVLNRSPAFISDASKFLQEWLLHVGIRLDPDRFRIADSRAGFMFLGFKFVHVWKNDKIKTKVRPSKTSCKLLLAGIKQVVAQSRGSSAHRLITRMAPQIERFGNYYKYSECHDLFRKLDHMIYLKLRPWVFRRRRHMGRVKAKLKFFPADKTWTFQGREHQSEWVLADKGLEKKKAVFLPQLRWMARERPPPKSIDSIAINFDPSALPDRRRRHVQLDTLLELWSKENLIQLDDEELEDFAQVMKLGNRELWKALTEQDDGSHLHLYDNPVFIKIKEDISRKLRMLFRNA